MARSKTEQTVAIENIVTENPEIKASEALPVLKDQGYKVSEATFNNVKCQFKKTLASGGSKPRKPASKPRKPRQKPQLVGDSQAAYDSLVEEFDGGLEGAVEYLNELQDRIEAARPFAELLAKYAS
ncbi:MAG: hypothetical protein ACYTBZ_29060 [Planctomycetota bacterium]|jgi:hypothetical protein